MATGRVASFRNVLTNEDAFRAWYEDTLPRVYGYLLTRSGRDHAVAEELTQETFSEVVRHASRFDGRSDVTAWVIGIARHRLADHYRRRDRRERGLLRLLAQQRPMPLWEPPSTDREDRLSAALAALPTAQRAAVVLHYLDDLPVREVARLLGRSEGAVESLLSRARASLRAARGEDR